MLFSLWSTGETSSREKESLVEGRFYGGVYVLKREKDRNEELQSGVLKWIYDFVAIELSKAKHILYWLKLVFISFFYNLSIFLNPFIFSMAKKNI